MVDGDMTRPNDKYQKNSTTSPKCHCSLMLYQYIITILL